MDNQDNYFANRRTIRKFSDRAVDDDMIGRMVSLASKAPTCGNMQLYSVIMTDNASERRVALNGAHFNQPATLAPVLLTICADFYRFCRWCELSDAKPGFDNFLSFTSAMLDATCFTQQLTTIAEMHGLGTCFLGTTTFNASKIAEILDLPEMVVPIATLAIGYPDEEGEETERLPVEALLYNDAYPRLSDAEISSLYATKDDFAPNRQYIEENGKKTLAQVFTDVRYPKTMNEEFSIDFLDFLRHQKFLK